MGIVPTNFVGTLHGQFSHECSSLKLNELEANAVMRKRELPTLKHGSPKRWWAQCPFIADRVLAHPIASNLDRCTTANRSGFSGRKASHAPKNFACIKRSDLVRSFFIMSKAVPVSRQFSLQEM
jgi:hypothetical protein